MGPRGLQEPGMGLGFTATVVPGHVQGDALCVVHTPVPAGACGGTCCLTSTGTAPSTARAARWRRWLTPSPSPRLSGPRPMRSPTGRRSFLTPARTSAGRTKLALLRFTSPTGPTLLLRTLTELLARTL